MTPWSQREHSVLLMAEVQLDTTPKPGAHLLQQMFCCFLGVVVVVVVALVEEEEEEEEEEEDKLVEENLEKATS